MIARKVLYERNIRAKHKLRVNVKSLVCESRIIRKEIKRILKTSDGTDAKARTASTLERHRKVVVRDETRHALLAMGFVKGTPYRRIEQATREGNEPNAERIANKLKRMCRYTDVSEVQEWILASGDD